MRFWPYREYKMYLSCTAADVLDVFSQNTVSGEPNPKRRRGDNTKAFVGSISTDGFSAAHYFDMDIIEERWLSFLLLNGSVDEYKGRTVLSLRLSLITVRKVGFALSMALCGVIIGAVLGTNWGEPFDYGLLVPMILVGYSYVLMRLGFRSAVRQTIEMLDELFGKFTTDAETTARD